jgi:hypothetical protein
MNEYNNTGGMITIAKKNKNKRMNILPKLITVNQKKEDNYIRNIRLSPI